MALGSSAPEILLSIIEICGKNFEAGDLGPGTIVGSAAFNMFVIIGICIVVIPTGSVRRIKHLSVFFVTSSWSIFAYLWLYFIIAISSPDEVVVWEALLTFIFFPVTVLTAYIADRKIFQRNFLKKRYIARRRLKSSPDEDVELNGKIPTFTLSDTDTEDPKDVFERTRLEYVEAIRNIRKAHPNIDPKELEELAQIEVLNKGPKSRALYRMQATRTLTGGGGVITKAKLERKLSIQTVEVKDLYGPETQQVFFSPGHYTVMENVGSFNLTVSRKGGDMSAVISVDFCTEDGTAVANEDYVPASGTLTFNANEAHKQISISIIDDDIFEEDEHFSVRLNNLKVIRSTNPMDLRLVEPSVATVLVLDDDHCGVFQFQSDSIQINESCGFTEIPVVRNSGARGVVRVPYKTVEGTAKGNGNDYIDASGYIEFENDQTEATIRVAIIDDNDYEKNEFFYIKLDEPILMSKDEPHSFFSLLSLRRSSVESASLTRPPQPSQMVKVPVPDNLQLPDDPVKADKILEEQGLETGRPRLGCYATIKVDITESTEFKNTVDRLVKQGKWSLLVGTSSWQEQFVDAVSVNGGSNGAVKEDADSDQLESTDDGVEVLLPSCGDYVMHFLTVFWKVVFAFVPPTDYLGGWLCFFVSIIAIGFLTAIIGDLASAFGCSVGLTDAVTATTFVALGTSLPDTFASKVAAVGDQYADSSIGNVTGSNAVNVFLGIGVAWTIAAIVHAVRGTKFVVLKGSLGFSVTIFCIFAVFSIVVLVLRRRKPVGGELGGPPAIKWTSAIFFLLLWIVYVLLTSLENYCHIVGF
ncbi:Sodium/calcium exchanger 3 [Sparganum proliferum]